MFAAEAAVYVLLPAQAGSTAVLDAAAALVLAGLAVVTLALMPRHGGRLLDADIAATWVLLAVLFGTRATRDGRIVVVAGLVLLAVFVSYARPRRISVAHLASMGVAFLVAALLSTAPFDFLLAAWTVAMIGTTAWVVVSLRERDRHLRVIVENAGDVVFHTREGIFLWVSPAAEEVLGWRPEQLVGVRKLDLWHPEDRHAALTLRERTREGQTTRETMRFRRPTGEYVWIEATLRPYVDAYGREGITGSMRDVSERLAARAALEESESEQRALAERLAAALNARTRLVQGISHEFRIPLTVIRAPLQRLARRAEGLGDDDRGELEAALRASRRLGRLVDELLVAVQADSGARLTVRESVDAATITAEAAEGFRDACEAAGLRLTVHLGSVPAAVWLDGEAWARIVTNLLSNAVRFTPAGAIDVYLDFAEPWLDLEVADTGVGVPEPDQAGVFERFQQGSVRAVRGAEGVGIGLAVVRELAVDLGGASGIRSEPGGGTSAWVRVTAVPVPPDDGTLSSDRPVVPQPDRHASSGTDGTGQPGRPGWSAGSAAGQAIRTDDEETGAT